MIFDEKNIKRKRKVIIGCVMKKFVLREKGDESEKK